MLKKPTPAPAPIVRSLADADPGYAAAKDLVARLRAASSKLDQEESELMHRLANRPAIPEKTGRVAALLGDALPDDDEAPDGLRSRLKAIAAERVDLRAAIDIAQQRLTTARFGASKTICDEVRPVYAARVKAVADALLSAHDAHSELLVLIDELNTNDIAWTGAMAPMHADRILGHRSDRLAIWLKDAADGGFISKSETPKELQQ
ncbi:hypothetical protein [Pararhizobium gei]|uniref:hypothetical protein n=1 Tax=Pararhizobium gei TaxID=1395951 RepID=UPI0023D9B239|nr:hypothetical protein [Rhizobium gei]